MLAVALQDSSRQAFSITAAQLTVGAIAVVLVVACVLFHYEAMSAISRLLLRLRLPHRPRIVVLILGMLLAHAVEIWMFGLTYWALDGSPTVGDLPGTLEEGALDFIYYSAVTYTTVGFGDIVPVGAIRVLTGIEALVGLTMITWTASFAFLEMQRDWAEFRGSRQGPQSDRRPRDV